MARRKIEVFQNINSEQEFYNALDGFKDKLICAEIYCEFSGHCTALDRLFTRIKMDWGAGDVEILRVLADGIAALSRFHGQSEPVYLFVVNNRVTRVFRGVDSIRFGADVRRELMLFREERSGVEVQRTTFALDEATPGEIDWLNARAVEKQIEWNSVSARHEDRKATRKQHRAELMAPHLQELDFVLYWPHATHAHPELYERWDENNIIMIAREELQLTKDQALDILYYGDAPTNEASIIALLNGKALAICLRALDPVHVVSLVRKILYEDDVKYSEEGKTSSTIFHMTAYDYYKTYSPTKEQIWQKRRESRANKKENEREKRARHFSEVRRLARQARADAIEAKKVAREQKKMDLLKAGKLAELEQMKEEPYDEEDVDIVVPEEDSYISEEESDIEEDPDEYFPPAGLPIPALYSPPNDIAKANGLAILFPKIVQDHVTPQEEVLPPHVLVMLHMHKRHKAIEHMTPHKYGIIHMGIFKCTTPYDAKHVAYSVKQFEAMDFNIHNIIDDLKLCFMVSTRVDVPLLELMDLNPIHVSRDPTFGEDECAVMFPVDYGDDYPEFEDFDYVD